MKNATAIKEKEQEKTQTPVQQSLQKRDLYPSYPFHTLQRDMNQLFEDFARGFDMWRPRFADPLFGDFQIKMDMKDNDHQIVLTAEVPGVEQKDIEVSLNDHILTIKGEKKEEKEEKEKGYFRSERNYGCFQRIVPLPCEIDQNAVEATFKNGVLKVLLPKSKESMKQSKKVEIKNG